MQTSGPNLDHEDLSGYSKHDHIILSPVAVRYIIYGDLEKCQRESIGETHKHKSTIMIHDNQVPLSARLGLHISAVYPNDSWASSVVQM